jgi:hypothetical protein
MKHTRNYHTCDRCGVEMEKPFNGGAMGTFSIHAVEDFVVCGGPALTWKELCGPCNSYVGRIILDLQGDQKEARKAANSPQSPGSPASDE